MEGKRKEDIIYAIIGIVLLTIFIVMTVDYLYQYNEYKKLSKNGEMVVEDMLTEKDASQSNEEENTTSDVQSVYIDGQTLFLRYFSSTEALTDCMNNLEKILLENGVKASRFNVKDNYQFDGSSLVFEIEASDKEISTEEYRVMITNEETTVQKISD